MTSPIRVDGSFGEGGGQILRSCLSLAAITGRPVEIFNIRAGREKPGLRAQHLAAVRAAAAICGAELHGDAVGSVYLGFAPRHEVRAGEYSFDIGTAGATTLVAQTVLLPLSLQEEPSRVTIVGGTHNPMAPTADYLEQVYAATLRAHGWSLVTQFSPPGFYPRGGGVLNLNIEPAVPQPIVLENRVGGHLRAYVVTSSLPPTVAERSQKVLKQALETEVVSRTEAGPSTGAAVTLVASNAGFSALGERGKPMERVTQDAIDLYRQWSITRAVVDEHLADQLVLPALFAPAPSVWRTDRLTEHLRTVLWVASQFAGFDYSLDEETGEVRVSPAEALRRP